uniref:Reverse transcriptase domain-containing protein n=1 Tax=Macrostomum lignano TaxID=282301 RepID=A0A1I8JH72_9PLAT
DFNLDGVARASEVDRIARHRGSCNQAEQCQQHSAIFLLFSFSCFIQWQFGRSQTKGDIRIDKEVELHRLCPKGQRPVIVSAIGALPKDNERVHLIHDCSRPASGCANWMKLTRGCWMTKVDLSEAYRAVGVHPDDFSRTGIKFCFRDSNAESYMYDTRLPFGAAASVTCFHRLSEVMKLMMVQRGFIRTEAYLDDFAFCGSREDCQKFLDQMTDLKEAVAPLLGVIRWREQLKGSRINIYCDNQAACHIINKGVSKCAPLQRLLQTVALMRRRYGMSVRAFHVPGEFQIFADAASRLHEPSQLLNFLLRCHGSVCQWMLATLHMHTFCPATAASLDLQAAKLRLSFPLSHRAASLLSASYAPPSRRPIYRHVMRSGWDSVHCPVVALLNHLADLVGTRMRSFSGVSSVASSLSLWFQVNSAPHLTKHAATAQLLRGAKRELGLRATKKRPVSSFMLVELQHQAYGACRSQLACWAAVICCWWGMLRKSSLLPCTTKGQALMQRSNLQRHPRGLVLRCDVGKTIQFKERVHLVLLSRLAWWLALCPVAALERHIRKSRLVSADQPLWSFCDARGNRRLLTGPQLDRFLSSKLARGCGLGVVAGSARVGCHAHRGLEEQPGAAVPAAVPSVGGGVCFLCSGESDPANQHAASSPPLESNRRHASVRTHRVAALWLLGGLAESAWLVLIEIVGLMLGELLASPEIDRIVWLLLDWLSRLLNDRTQLVGVSKGDLTSVSSDQCRVCALLCHELGLLLLLFATGCVPDACSDGGLHGDRVAQLPTHELRRALHSACPGEQIGIMKLGCIVADEHVGHTGSREDGLQHSLDSGRVSPGLWNVCVVHVYPVPGLLLLRPPMDSRRTAWPQSRAGWTVANEDLHVVAVAGPPGGVLQASARRAGPLMRVVVHKSKNFLPEDGRNDRPVAIAENSVLDNQSIPGRFERSFSRRAVRPSINGYEARVGLERRSELAETGNGRAVKLPQNPFAITQRRLAQLSPEVLRDEADLRSSVDLHWYATAVDLDGFEEACLCCILLAEALPAPPRTAKKSVAPCPPTDVSFGLEKNSFLLPWRGSLSAAAVLPIKPAAHQARTSHKTRNIKAAPVSCARRIPAAMQHWASHFDINLSGRVKSVPAELREALETKSAEALQEDNAKLKEKNLEVYYANEEKQRCQEKMQQQQQKLDRLLESNKQFAARLASLEKQLTVVKDTCNRFEPAAKALAKRCAAQQRIQSHYRCFEQLANSRIEDECRRVASLQTRLGMTAARVLAQDSETEHYQSVNNEQRLMISYLTKQVQEQDTKIEELKVKLAEAHELISDQSELLLERSALPFASSPSGGGGSCSSVLILTLIDLVGWRDNDAAPDGHLSGDAGAALQPENVTKAAVAEHTQQGLRSAADLILLHQGERGVHAHLAGLARIGDANGAWQEQAGGQQLEHAAEGPGKRQGRPRRILHNGVVRQQVDDPGRHRAHRLLLLGTGTQIRIPLEQQLIGGLVVWRLLARLKELRIAQHKIERHVRQKVAHTWRTGRRESRAHAVRTSAPASRPVCHWRSESGRAAWLRLEAKARPAAAVGRAETGGK